VAQLPRHGDLDHVANQTSRRAGQCLGSVINNLEPQQPLAGGGSSWRVSRQVAQAVAGAITNARQWR
jgi:hypothetical protein